MSPTFFYFKDFYFFLNHLVLMVKNTFSHIFICIFDKIINKISLVLHSHKNTFYLHLKIKSSNLEGKQYPHEGIQ
jgi:hypothetical protein